MMRKVIVAALAASPMLLHAQASKPVQPVAAATTLVSKLNQPAAVPTAAPDHPTVISSPRASTGVTAPRLIHTVEIETEGENYPYSRIVVVHMDVDTAGTPHNIAIVNSNSPAMDESVIRAVNQYRFKPGTLDNQPCAVPVTLEITVLNPHF